MCSSDLYHDPCQLVRYLEIVDEPRRILQAVRGLELVEPEATKCEWSTCCGGGGGFEPGMATEEPPKAKDGPPLEPVKPGPPPEKKGGALPILALLGAAAYAYFKK